MERIEVPCMVVPVTKRDAGFDLLATAGRCSSLCCKIVLNLSCVSVCAWVCVWVSASDTGSSCRSAASVPQSSEEQGRRLLRVLPCGCPVDNSRRRNVTKYFNFIFVCVEETRWRIGPLAHWHIGTFAQGTLVHFANAVSFDTIIRVIALCGEMCTSLFRHSPSYPSCLVIAAHFFPLSLPGCTVTVECTDAVQGCRR